jgi:murein DD-endopeptidase MepM/ murein hydrolase activator NlpD
MTARIKFRRLELFFGLVCLILGISLVAFDMYQYQVSKEQQELLEDALSLSDEEATPDTTEEKYEDSAKGKFLQKAAIVKKAESLKDFLGRQNLSAVDINALIKAIKTYYPQDKLKPGQHFYFVQNAKGILHKVIFFFAPDKKLTIIRGTAVPFTPLSGPQEVTKQIEYVHGTIRDSLYADGKKYGLSSQTLNKLIQIYSYSIDFQRALRRGDTFEVLVERLHDPETGYNETNNILYATLYIAGGPQHIYRFVGTNGVAEYFSERGQSIKRALLTTPVKGARISSGFGNRLHPIQGFTKKHQGVDFSAPHGTPVVAAGDGHIRRIGHWGAYGNYILVAHTADYSTAYAHLSKFAPGMKMDKFVKQGQVIGYVGATGRATGPHLHYEVHHRKIQINPQTMSRPAQQRLRGKRLEQFLQHKKAIDEYLTSLKDPVTPKKTKNTVKE